MPKFQIPTFPIANEIIFEEMICDLMNEIKNTHSFQLFGRKGQFDAGIDVISNEKKIAVQCKKKDLTRDSHILKNELLKDLRKDVLRAKKIRDDGDLQFDEYILTTTFNDNSELVKEAARLEKEISNSFKILYWGWDKLTNLLISSPNTLQKYYSEFVLTKKVNFINLVPNFDIDEIIGREIQLNSLHTKLMKKDNVFLVNGIGGIGKTTLALAYVNNVEFNKFYDNIVWITSYGELKKSLVSQLSDFNKDYNKEISTNENKVKNLISELSRIKGTNLLVIDNVNNLDDLTFIHKELNSIHWKIITTSRIDNANFTQNYIFKISELTQNNAIELFYKYYSNEKNTEDLIKILQIIEYNTLLIELLAKATFANPKLNIKKVLEILENDKINPLQSDKLQGIIQINNTIYDLFETKMQSILNTVFQISELSENEKQVLSFFSVLPSIEIIAEDLCLLFSISENEEIDFFNTLNSLSNKGWLIRRSNQYKIHASIQLIVKSQLTISENLKNKFTNSLIDILFISLTYNPIQKDKYIPFGETFISISKKITFEIAILLNNLAEIIRYTGDFEKSQKYYENAILFFESEPEKYLTELSILYNNIATLLRYKGEFLKAIEYLNKSIEISFKQSIISNTLIFKNNIATAYRYLGNFAMSLKHHNFIIDEILKNKTTDYNLVNVLFNNYQNTFRYFGLKNSEKNIELKNFVKNSDFWLPHKKLSLGLSIFSEIIKTRNRDLEFIEPRYKWDTRASYKQSPFFRHAPVHSSSWDNDDINEDSLNFLWLETSALVEYFINQHNKANFFINEAFVQVKNIEQKPNNEDYEELLNWKRKINEISLNWQKNIEKENI